MLNLRNIVLTLTSGIVALSVVSVSAQDYPSRPIRIVTAEAGGGGDFAARVIAQGLLASVGQPVIVDNRPGGLIPAEIVSKASPDGYTLLFLSPLLWTGALMQKAPYDPVKDFSPITLAVSSPTILVVPPALPVKSAKDLIALAKTEPGKLNYGTTGTGTSNHLAAELFKSMAGVDMVRINFKSAAAALNDLIGSRVQLMFATAGSVTPHVKSGRLRALAVTTAQPSPSFPELPTVAASGLPGYESGVVYGVFAPAKTSKIIIDRLNHEIVRVLNLPAVKEKFLSSGIDTVGNSPEAFARWMKADIDKMSKLIRDAGIKVE
jgi:tripartite-type tricarboxylate transporter receptor subunit TctC